MKPQVPEDQRTIELLVSQFIGQSPPTAFAADCQLHRDLDGYVGIPDEHPAWGIQPVPSCDHRGFPWDPPSDQSRLCVSPLDLFEGHREDDAFFEGSSDSVHSDKRAFPFDPLPGFHQPVGRPAAPVAYTSFGDSTVSRELGCHDKESVKQEGEGRTDSFLDGSDQMGDDDDEQKTGRSERRPSCKNLMAERKRRKKLNDRLYDLRSLVPKISKVFHIFTPLSFQCSLIWIEVNRTYEALVIYKDGQGIHTGRRYRIRQGSAEPGEETTGSAGGDDPGG